MNLSTSWWSSFFTGLSASVVSRLNNPQQTLLEADFIQKALQLQPGATIGDLPCGSGRLMIELTKRGFQARGLDISSELIESAIRSANEAGVSLQTEVGNERAHLG